MARTRKQWIYQPAKPLLPALPARLKADVQAQAQRLIDDEFGPQHIKPPPADARLNYIVAISGKWWRHYFYFSATYCVPGPDALAPSFEAKFARMEYAGGDRFHLAFMRHTGEWIEVYEDRTLAESLAAIKDDPFFFP